MTALELDQLTYDQGVQDGRTALEAEIAARTGDVLAPVPVPWSAVAVGDVIRAPKGGGLWWVQDITPGADGLLYATLRGPNGARYPAPGHTAQGAHPDERVPVLFEMPESQALSVLREHFGGLTVMRRLEAA